MVYFSRVREHKDLTLTAAKTDSFDVPESGVIDTIIPLIRSINSDTAHLEAYSYIFHHLTAIELIANGKTPLFSLTGDQLLARYFHDHGKLPPSTLEQYAKAESFLMLPMYFGRHVKDPDYGLDASKWSDLKLKITNDVDGTDINEDELEIDVDIIYHEDQPAIPTKYMLPYEYESYTPESDTASKRIELPDRKPARKIWITMDRDRADATSGYTCHPYELIKSLKLILKNRVLTVFDEDWARHLYFNIMDWEHYGDAHVRVNFYNATYYADLLFAYPQNVEMTVCTQDAATTQLVNFHHGQERLLSPRGLTGANVQVALDVWGWGILDSFTVMDQTKLGEANYLDPAKYRPAHLEFESSKDDGEIQVVVEELWVN